MAREKLPHMPWYVGDWLKDPGIQSLSYHHQGIWFALLMRMWESEDRGKLVLNGSPISDHGVARLLGLSFQETTKTLAVILGAGVGSRDPETGALMSRRMVRDEQLRSVRSDAGRRGGRAGPIGSPLLPLIGESRSGSSGASRTGDSLLAQAKVQAKPKQNPDSDNDIDNSGSEEPGLRFPKEFTDKFRETFEKWREVRQAMGKKPRDWDVMFQEQLDWLATFGEAVATEIVSSSMRNNFQGLHPPKTAIVPGKPVGPRSMSAMEIGQRTRAVTEEINACWRGCAVGPAGKRIISATVAAEIARLKQLRTDLHRKMIE